MNLNKIALIFVFILIFNIYFSQPTGLPGNGNGPSCWPPPCVPIDGGISIFTFISILFGYKFLARNK